MHELFLCLCSYQHVSFFSSLHLGPFCPILFKVHRCALFSPKNLDGFLLFSLLRISTNSSILQSAMPYLEFKNEQPCSSLEECNLKWNGSVFLGACSLLGNRTKNINGKITERGSFISIEEVTCPINYFFPIGQKKDREQTSIGKSARMHITPQLFLIWTVCPPFPFGNHNWQRKLFKSANHLL